MKLAKTLFLTLALGALFLLILSLEPRMSYTKTQAKRVANGFKIAERMNQETKYDFQVQSWLNKFKTDLINRRELFFDTDEIPEYLKKWLPIEKILVVESSDDGVLKRANTFGTDFPLDWVVSFLKADCLLREKTEDEIEEGLLDELEKNVSKGFYNLIGNRVTKLKVVLRQASKMVLEQSETGTKALLWDKFRLGERVGYIFIKLDFLKFNSLYPIKSFFKFGEDSGYNCAFYFLGSKKILGNPGFMSKIESDFVKWLEAKLGEIGERPAKANYRGQEVFIGSKSYTYDFRPLVILPEDINSKLSLSWKFKLVFLILFFLVLIMVTETLIFQRGFKQNLGRVLAGAFMLAILMPFFVARSVFLRTLIENSEKERLKIERDLHDTLIGLDEGVRIFHMNLLANLKNYCRTPSVVKSILNEERMEGNTGDIDKVFSSIKADEIKLNPSWAEDFTVNDSIAEYIASAGIQILRKDLNFSPEKEQIINSILVSGPNSFIRFFDRQRRKTLAKRSLGKNDNTYYLLEFFRSNFAERLNKKIIHPGFDRKKIGAVSSLDANGLQFEMAEKELVTAIGEGRTYNKLINADSLNWFQTSVGFVHFALFPCEVNGIIRYFISAAWDEFAIDPLFLRRKFIQLGKTNTGGEPTHFQAYSPMIRDNLSSNETESRLLTNLINSCLKKGQIMREETFEGVGSEGAALYEVIPGKFIKLYTIGAKKETGFLKKEYKKRQMIFNIGIFIFIIFSIVAGFNISRSFTNPLEHLLWGMSRIDQNDYKVRLKTSREDEFGSLSVAFNRMAKRLQEKDLLDKYVSQSVKKLTSEPELFAKAQLGSEEWVTILFADLIGFKELQESSSDEDIQKAVETGLSFFFEAAEKSGGEVDKVIGEKVLITFRHDQMGDDKAAQAAIDVARDISGKFEGVGSLVPYFGINSGKVIAGIIGTPSVRMDYTVIGDPVNVAARLCGVASNTGNKVVISGITREILASKKMAFEKLDVKNVKGKKQEVEAFKLVI